MPLTVDENSYLSLADANTYLADALHATAWAAATDPNKEKALITATRMLDRQQWAGTKTDPAQPLAWPRTGVTDRDGNAIDEDTVPQDIINAECELANSLLANSSVQTDTSSGSNIRKVQAGSASVEYFRPVAGGRFPTIVQELVGYLMQGSSSGLMVPFDSGTDVDSFFADDSNTYDTLVR